MPYILGLDENEERAVRNERKARRNLMICNLTFVIFSIVCISVNYLGQLNNVWICQRIRPLQGIPYFLLAGVLIYSMCKVKSWLKQSPMQLYLNTKLIRLFMLVFVSYIFQYLIAYPLHVIGKQSQETISFIKSALYYTAACIVGYVILLVVQAKIISMLLKFTRVRKRFYSETNR